MPNPKSLNKDYTHPALVYQVCTHLRDNRGVDPRRVLDPSAGSGVFGRVVREVWPDAKLVGIEPREEEHEHLATVYDHVIGARFGPPVPGLWGRFDLVITNPPFPEWEDFLDAALDRCARQALVVFLGLRSWGSRSESGVVTFRRHAPDEEARIPGAVGFRDRDGFAPLKKGQKKPRKNGTDQRDYSWWIWDQRNTSGSWTSHNLDRLPSSHRSWRGVEPGRETPEELQRRMVPDWGDMADGYIAAKRAKERGDTVARRARKRRTKAA